MNAIFKNKWIVLLLMANLFSLAMVGCGSVVEESPRSEPTSPSTMSYSLDKNPVVASRFDKPATHLASFELQPGEELWVLVEPERRSAVPDDVPGSGALMAHLGKDGRQVPVPLKHTSVEGDIHGYIATISVTQQFLNPYDSKIEAVYVFPLPQNAAVNDFLMTVGQRKIRGIIRPRQQAEQIYRDARRQGHVASLLTQQRPNVFTQKVANIEPGHQIDIQIRYFHTLQYNDGWYEFVFPMVIGPRFNPPSSANGVGAVALGGQGRSGQFTEVSYLAPGERSGHDISLALDIDAGVPLADIRGVNHAIETNMTSPQRCKVQLSPEDTVPNKDFVLRYRVAGEQTRTTLLTHRDQQGDYFTMIIYPPIDLSTGERSAMELIFVLDCSGSMRGRPLEQAKRAVACALHKLRPDDTFQIIRFSSDASQLGSAPLLATPSNVRRGLRYLDSLDGSGGTQMLQGVRAALGFAHDDERFRFISFMTDGFIGNETEILGAVHGRLGASRIFSFGVGQSPNRYLLDRLAVIGRGAVAYLSLNDNAAEVMDQFAERISHPAMTDIAIDWGDMKVRDVYPQRLPDLIVGRQVVVTGRFEGSPSSIRVEGRVGGERRSFTVPTDDSIARAEHSGIAAVWARMKIADLMNQHNYTRIHRGEQQQAITHVALRHNVMSAYTAMVAVDSLTRTAGQFGTTVAVPVPVPEGVRYETTVSK